MWVIEKKKKRSTGIWVDSTKMQPWLWNCVTIVSRPWMPLLLSSVHPAGVVDNRWQRISWSLWGSVQIKDTCPPHCSLAISYPKINLAHHKGSVQQCSGEAGPNEIFSVPNGTFSILIFFFFFFNNHMKGNSRVSLSPLFLLFLKKR